MADNKKQNTVLHKRSTKKDVLPKGETLQYGEIAVNYNAEAPFLSIRKEGENKEYAKFSADEVIAKMFDEKYVTIEDLEDNEEVIASALNELNDRIESIQGVNIGNSTGESSLLQKVEVETFVDENPDSPTNGQEIPTEASGNHSVVLNGKSNASAKRALAHGNRTIAQGENSHTEGHCTQTVCIDEVTNGYAAHAEGYASMAGGTYSHAEGNKTKTAAPNSHAEGYLSITTPEAESSHAEGYETSTEAPASHTEGNNTKTHKAYSHAEGRQTETFGEASHTEGNETITEGDYAHAEGWMTRAKGAYSHAEGQYTFTYADAAHSEGNNTHAQAPFSHAEGLGTKTNPDIIGQHVEGYYNAESDGVKVIGCGTADDARMNAVEVKQDGRVFVKGLGNFDGTNSNEAADLTHVINTKADKNDVYGRGHLDNLFNTKANKDDVYGKSEINNLLNSKENISKKVQIISSASETSEYPSAKAVYDYAAPISHIHDDRYYTESEIDKKFDDVASRYGFGNILVGDKTVTADINVDTLTLKGENGITLTPELDTDTITIAIESDKFAPKSHTHTKSEITDFAHNHDDRYYTESEVDAKISGITAASLGLSAALKYCGITTTELVDGSTTNPVVIGGNNHTAEQGCVVFYEDGKNTKEFVFNGTKWELLGSDLTYKVVQNAVSSPTANGNAVSFIDTISQDANGVITATKKNVDMPIVKGDAEHSAILKGEKEVLGVTYKNEALNEGCVSLGANSKAGKKGYYFTYIDFENKKIWLHDKQFTTKLLGWKKNSVTDSNRCLYKVGDDISIVCNGHYELFAKISDVTDNVITIDQELPFTEEDVPSVINNIIDGVNNKFDECSVSAYYYNESTMMVERHNVGPVDLGGGAFAEGTNTYALGACSHAEGYNTQAIGKYSHAEGRETKAVYAAHAEGINTVAGEGAHAEGYETIAGGKYSHAEGHGSRAMNEKSHAEGGHTLAEGWYSHAEGYKSEASATASHAEGYETKAIGKCSHTEGAGLSYNDVQYGVALGENSHAEGQSRAEAKSSHSEGDATIARGKYSHAEGCETLAEGESSHSEGYLSQAIGKYSHAEGENTVASGRCTHAEGRGTYAYGRYSHVEGYNCSTQRGIHIDDLSADWDSDPYSIASHAEGNATLANGNSCHSEGIKTLASGDYSHAEGECTEAKGRSSHAEGNGTWALGDSSHAEGRGTITHNTAEHASGQYNVSNSGKTIHSVGIGTFDTDRKNAHEITTDGKHYIFGIGGYDGTKLDGVQTLQEVINAKADVIPLVNITYNELKDLRDNSQLIPGQQYRITDYVTTTTQSDTLSAGHQFDIIVIADDVNVLNENARAIQHEGDTYFANSDLNAWEIWYSLDNDTSRFAWADESNGKGVIYRMIDEFGNECPYDFKNIMFKRWKLNAPETVDSEPWLEQLSTNIQQAFENNILSYIWGGTDGYKKHWETAGDVYSTSTEEINYFYTFSNIISDVISDKSLNTDGKYCYGNVIKESEYCLNNIIFFNTSATSFCEYNNFGNNCEYNSFGNNCDYNSFGNNCRYNSFGNTCDSNSFGNYCDSNSFGNTCNSNSFGGNCYFNSFGNTCDSNSFGNTCHSNSFGGNCKYNSFGNTCKYNSFVYKKEDDSEIVMDHVKKVHFGDGCNNIKLYADSDIVGTISNANSIQNIDVAQGLSFNSSTIIELTTLGQDYEIKVARNSAGDIKVFCLADLIA